MSFSQFVIRNTLRNKHLYMAYFLSTLFSVMVFFTFTVFAFHPALANGLNKNAQIGMLASASLFMALPFSLSSTRWMFLFNLGKKNLVC